MKNYALSRNDRKNIRFLAHERADQKTQITKGVKMINKTIIATLCVTAVLLTLIITKADPMFIYACLALIGALNGVSIWKANHKP